MKKKRLLLELFFMLLFTDHLRTLHHTVEIKHGHYSIVGFFPFTFTKATYIRIYLTIIMIYWCTCHLFLVMQLYWMYLLCHWLNTLSNAICHFVLHFILSVLTTIHFPEISSNSVCSSGVTYYNASTYAFLCFWWSCAPGRYISPLKVTCLVWINFGEIWS